MKFLILSLVALLGCSSVAAADCLGVAATAIQQRGVADWVRGDPAPTLEEVYQNSSTSETLIGYRAWFRVARCTKGYVVVNMRTTCAIMSIWREGDCNVPEIR
jgi:hypothetical protein